MALGPSVLVLVHCLLRESLLIVAQLEADDLVATTPRVSSSVDNSKGNEQKH